MSNIFQDEKDLRPKVLDAIKKYNLKQIDIAHEVNIHHSTLSQWLQRKSKISHTAEESIENWLNNIYSNKPIYAGTNLSRFQQLTNRNQNNKLIEDFDSNCGFDNLIPIKNFADVINQAKNYGISFTCVIKTLFSIMNIYGKNEADIIRVCFPNVIYLYANDLFTLNEISIQCGGKNKTNSISDYEELKTLQPNEAIIIMPRVMPFKSELKNYSQVNWPTK